MFVNSLKPHEWACVYIFIFSRVQVPIRLEVCQSPHSTLPPSEIQAAVIKYYESRSLFVALGPLQHAGWQSDLLSSHIAFAEVAEIGPGAPSPPATLPFWAVDLAVDVYRLRDDGPADDDELDDAVPSFREWLLPCPELRGLWEALEFDSDIKARLLRYASSALLFADAGVNPQLIQWNRLVLLHGPPGTGKTSLCHALAQKLAIRLSRRFPLAQLIEVNAHSLFSKWFSESGKLVSRLFQSIQEAVDDPSALVFVVIDEVESLTAARKAAISGSEPSDAVRAVNALLTQLDQLRTRPNVLVLTTSNLVEAIDAAFVDRADIKAFIGPPGEAGRYSILRSCVSEVVRAGIVTGHGELTGGGESNGGGGTAAAAVTASTLASTLFLPYTEAHVLAAGASQAQGGPIAEHRGDEEEDEDIADMRSQDPSVAAVGSSGRGGEGIAVATASVALLRIVRLLNGFSGRTLRKLPFLAHANFVSPAFVGAGRSVSLMTYLEALQHAAVQEVKDRASFVGGVL